MRLRFVISTGGAKRRSGEISTWNRARFLDCAHFVRFARNDNRGCHPVRFARNGNKGHYASRTNDLSIVPFMLLKRTWLDLRYLRTP